jgi:putative DNA primase/helicase
VLAWIVEGVYEWQRRGLAVPDLVKHATQIVRLGMDPLRDFFDECCLFEPDVWTSTGDLRAAYDHWRKTYSQARGIGAKEWGLRLSARGLETNKRNGVRGWLGVHLADAEYVQSTLGEGR